MRVVHYLRYSSRPARNVLRMHVRGLNTSGRGGRRSLLKLTSGMVGVVGLGCGGMIGLCKVDPSYRPMIEKNVPLSSLVLSLALDEKQSKKLDSTQVFPAIKVDTIKPSTKTPKAEEEAIELKNKEKYKIEPNVELITSLKPEQPESVEVNDYPKPKKKKKRKKKAENKEELVSKKEEPVMEPQLAEKTAEKAAAVASAESLPVEETKTIPTKSIHEEKIEAVINESLVDLEPPALKIPEVKPEPEPTPDETAIIIDALKTLDYEPVLADSVLEILVGKAANKEKATMATISRLENAMAAVVNEVQKALEHHNHISELVSKSKDMAQQISQATDKNDAKASLSQLIESSAAVESAFKSQEKIDKDVQKSFEKLSEIITKAEQFDLKGPAAAARALLGKSRTDYLTSCETAQEHQVDHALVSHYRNSVSNRKKVLEQELAILQDHFPKQHEVLNKTFDAAAQNKAQVEELNTLISYLSTKVGRLENELENQHISELEKLKLVAEAQKSEDAKMLEEKLKLQREELRIEYEKSRHSEVESAVSKTRDECAKQSERQLAVLKQELEEKSDKRIRNISENWVDEVKLRESVIETEYQRKLEKSNKVLSLVSDHIAEQNERYEGYVKNLRLFVLATSLHEATHVDCNVDNKKISLIVTTIKDEFQDDGFVTTVTGTLPAELTNTSVNDLKDRFNALDKKCRRSALATTDEINFRTSFLSNLMSALTFRSGSYNTPPEEGGVHNMYYLSKAEAEVRDGRLDVAARYMNQLIGKPRYFIQESKWLEDARALFELQQTTSVLLNYAKAKVNSV